MSTPKTEIQRRSRVKKRIASIESEQRQIWRMFKKEVKGELVGSPYYEATYRRAMEATRELKAEASMLAFELPPHLVWRPDLGCLERVLVHR